MDALGSVGAAALAALSAAGCGKQAGRVTWATYREVGTLDPIQAFDYPENSVITSDGLAALEGYTTGAAFVGSDEHRLGRVRAGFCADLTVFAEDPVECDADDLVALPVVLTVVDGEIVFRG
jgi:predicted amidohydrolase YtcJ